MEFVVVTATDGTKIPILAHLVSTNALIKVEGDGSCRLSPQDDYLVTVLNSVKGKALSEKIIDKSVEKGKEAALDKIKDVIKEEAIPAILRGMGLKKTAMFLVRGLKLVSSVPIQLILAPFTDATDIGEEKEGYYRQRLPNNKSATIHWIGEPA